MKEEIEKDIVFLTEVEEPGSETSLKYIMLFYLALIFSTFMSEIVTVKN